MDGEETGCVTWGGGGGGGGGGGLTHGRMSETAHMTERGLARGRIEEGRRSGQEDQEASVVEDDAKDEPAAPVCWES